MLHDSNVDPEKLAKVLQKHRRIKAYDWVGWACTCGTPVINNTMQTLSIHQAEIVLDYIGTEMIQRLENADDIVIRLGELARDWKNSGNGHWRDIEKAVKGE